jgi:hypothetical protein
MPAQIAGGDFFSMGKIDVYAYFNRPEPPPLPYVELGDDSVQQYVFSGKTNFRRFPDPLPGTEDPPVTAEGIRLGHIWKLRDNSCPATPV